jgi:hypothetical protein
MVHNPFWMVQSPEINVVPKGIQKWVQISVSTIE